MIKIGFLPLYVKLYDDVWPHLRERINNFNVKIQGEFIKRGIDLVSSPVCRLQSEFEDAVKLFESEGVDSIVTLHLAYSPSLESIAPLSITDLPIVVLDTTETFDFLGDLTSDKISFNHGIHGVQDMCCMLLRNDKKFFIDAGHWQESNVIDRVIEKVKGLKIAKNIKNVKVLRVGGYFAGMGDFVVSDLESKIGIKTETFDPKFLNCVTDEEINSEINFDMGNYNIDDIDENIYRNATKAGLAIRKCLQQKNLTALTVNFMEITKSGLQVMPFLECCKSMANGIGYAGEGDVLTAALVGSLLEVFPETTFAEMFCPDWKNNTIFFSHMGEINPNLLADKPRVAKKEFIFNDADDTTYICGRMKKGQGVLVNLAPSKDSFTLIVAPMNALDIPAEGSLKDTVSGFLTPNKNISEFLTEFSKAGGTHHSAFVYGDVKNSIIAFGEAMNFNIVTL